jgi:hypothetical protein
MTFVETLVMLFRWKQQGWEVHPLITDECWLVLTANLAQ